MASDYQTDLNEAKAGLRKLLDQREQLETDIARQRFRIASLMALTEPRGEIDQVVGMSSGGLTDACRTALRSASSSLTPIQVKDRLARLGFPVNHYKNVMAAIHTVLKRLVEARELFVVRTEGGGMAYQWISPIARALAEEMAHGPGAAMMAAFTARQTRETATDALQATDKNRKK
jgi:hypothetical protein